ncbi:MAG: Chemotaxis system protein containing CheF-like and HTH domain, archaellum-associated [Candidatus Methanohalarchaeum thermophilum]|uniref:Chemotaxis system protein containing CheF-like and HTH domain, archaellum-associated n=1 Tax=Methanohalarchaeum thermophilum TaxID=1903181 RepID=A0A1Q6DTS9_METT1|nr:MAG: Chemotaxis system protein containing CheF-like and HTH domain, archaellum-associated [Candidatus Methanohalarchaeum thermophilum]
MFLFFIRLGKIILSNKNIWLISKNNQKINLKKIREIGGNYSLNEEILNAGDYLSIIHERNNDKCVSLIKSNKEKN